MLSINDVHWRRLLLMLVVTAAPAAAADYDYDPVFGYRTVPRPSYIRPDVYGYAYDPYGTNVAPSAYTADRYMVARPSRFGWSVYDRDQRDLGVAARPIRPETTAPLIERNPTGAEVFGYVPPEETAVRQAAPVPPVQDQNEPVAANRRPQSFEGEVLELAQVTTRQDNRVHYIARIREPDGTLKAIALGPSRNIVVFNGDWLKGTGSPGVLQNRPVLFTDSVQVNDGPWLTIERQPARPVRNYQGEVLAINRLFLEGTAEPQIMADIRLPGGRVVSALLGPANTLRSDFIEVGDRISFWARDVYVNNIPVLMTDQLEVNGQQFTNAYPTQVLRFQTR